MPTFKNFKDDELKTMKKIASKASDAILNAQTAYISDTTLFDTNFKTWFGEVTDEAKEDVVYTLALMNGEITNDNYAIELSPANGIENSNMDHFRRLYLHGREAVDKIWEANREYKKNNDPLPMTIRPKLFLMPFTDQTRQSQVETFLHELSHFAAGVVDYDSPNCYHVAGTKYCSNAGVHVAVRNAENVGFFVQSFVQ
jgi:hypothetical protein